MTMLRPTAIMVKIIMITPVETLGNSWIRKTSCGRLSTKSGYVAARARRATSGMAVRSREGSSRQPRRAWSNPVAREAALMRLRTPALGVGAATSAALRRPLAEQSFGAEDEDGDEDREDERAGPVSPRCPDREALVERLDEPDEQGSEYGPRQVPDAAENRG